MKIERLHFKNINSLKGEHHVNFDESPLNSGGLFAIIGPTGSGKSTLLDAICLALYGRTPRISSVTKSKIEQDGSILTKYQTDAFAKVKFSCNSGSYISTWSISTNRNGNLREYDMDLWNIATEKSFCEKKSEVIIEIQRLIGLSYDQFVKSVLLSQGEFATLLQSNEKDRSDLLEKITNTSIYRQIGKKVYEKFKSLESNISEQKTLLKDLKDKLLDDEVLLEKQKNKSKLEQIEHLQQSKLSLYEKELDQFRAKEKLDHELEIESKNQIKFKTEFDEFQNKNTQKLNQHSKTLAFEEELLKHNALVEKKESHREAIQIYEKESSRITDDTHLLKTKIEGLLKKEIEHTEIENQLNTFLKAYQKLDYERKLKRNDYKSKMEVLNKEISILDLKFKNQPISEFRKNLLAQLEASEQKIKSFNIEFKADETLEEAISFQHLFLGELKEAKHDQKSIQEIKERIEKLEIQYKKENEELLRYPEIISTRESEMKELERSLLQLETEKENQSLRLEVNELRKKLTESEPCPVCGSIHHPFAEHKPALDTELDKRLSEQKHQLKLISNKLAHLKAEQTAKSRRIKELEDELQSMKQNFQNQQENFAKNYQNILSKLKDKSLIELTTSTENTIKHLEELKKLQIVSKALKSSLSTLKELDEIGKQGNRLKTEMDELYDGENLNDIISEMQKNWIRLNSNLTSTKELLRKEIENAKIIESQLTKLQSNLLPKIKASEFSSISEANSSRMKAADYQALNQELNTLTERLYIQKEKIKGITSQVESLKFEFFTNKDEAQQEINDLTSKLKKTKIELEEVRRQLKNNSDTIERFKLIEQSIKKEQKANKKWDLLNKLIGDATGNEFNKFAQDLSLQRLIHLGNKRLKHLNERYELDRYLPNEDRDQLYIIDHHMGGMRRSVKTLSGGETFLMSLALALGLSDLASRNVEINSLFIDEGFGTLDPETLDVTLDTLERLQAESSKTIGIISHVSSLKERIQTQIVLDRNAQGYSQLKIVG